MLERYWNRIRENRNLSIAVAIAILLLILVAGITIRNRRSVSAQNANLQIATVERGNLIATIGATGQVRANQSAKLFWESSGTVESVSADIGDMVEAGERLAELQLNSLPQNVILAQRDLKNAEEELEAFYDSYGDLGLADAEIKLLEAQEEYEDATRDYSYVFTGASQPDVDQAFANMILARDQLDKAEDDYEPYANKPENNLVRANLLSRLAQARRNYNDAVRTYNAYSTPGTESDVALADAEVSLAEAELAKAQEEFEEILSGPSAQAIAAAEAQVAAAEATLSQAYIEAPFGGIVTDLYPIVGDQVSTGLLAFQLDDLSKLLVDVDVSEVDVNRVQVGQSASLVFDAVANREYSGEVLAVSLAGNTDQGAVHFRVIIELLDPDENVRPGMTAAVNIVVTELTDVLLVPNRAVRFRDGERVVYVVSTNGNLEPVSIVLGASSENLSEIASGDFQEGDSIVLNPPSISFDSGGGQGPFGGGGFQ